MTVDESTSSTRMEPSRKRIRALVGGVVAADSVTPLLVWEKPYYPTYYLPRADVRGELVDTGERDGSLGHGDGHLLDLVLGDKTLPGAALSFPDSSVPGLRDLVRLDWDVVDQWLEEDEPVYVHPRDPYKRVDVLASSRHVRVEVDGVTVADSTQPRILFETGLIPRYYLPLTDVRTDLLRSSDTVSHCPYKGSASWWSLDVDGVLHTDIAWTYRTPLAESQKVAGLVCFYDELVDVWIDGEHQERPATPLG